MSTGDEELDMQLICSALVQNDFDFDKTAIQLRETKICGKRRMLDVLARWEANIVNLERTTHNPETRLAYRRFLADIRKGRAESDEVGR